MTSLEGLIAWCREQQASLRQQLEMLASGRMTTRGPRGRDTTAETMERVKRQLAELDALLVDLSLASAEN